MEIEKVFKKTGYTSIITSILLGILGLIMFLYADTTLKIITYILGGTLILVGIIKVIGYFSDKGSYDFFNYELIYGIINIIIGIVLITHTGILEGLLGIVLGIWIIYSCLMRFGLSLKLKSYKRKSWIPTLILSILMGIVGIYIIVSPDIIIATLGLIVLVYSIMDLIEGITFIVSVKKFEKMEEE
ncbi:MAG: DUF308 domain-containing protein [Clostridia bacterium]